MKSSTFTKIAVSAALVLGVSANADITNSLHNLSATGLGTIKASAAESATFNDEICVFCHTPHAANTGFPTVPIWNKATPASGSFTMYGTTVAGNSPDAQPNSPSLACLSCHDGVSGINSVVNAPGSGGYVPGGGFVDFMGQSGAAFTMPAGVTQIGTDLTNDHPVSITYVDTAPRPASLKPTTDNLLGTWSGATTIADVLRNGKVECVSCHDPHLGATQSTTFLKRLGANGAANAGSQLCLSCHDK